MDERKMDQLFEKIKAQNSPDPGLAGRLTASLRHQRNRGWAGYRPGKLALWAAAVAFATALLSVTALAAVLPGFRAWLFGPDSDMGSSLQETSAVTEAMGFRAEVLGTVTDLGNVVIYYTLEDVERGDRLSMDTVVDSSARLASAYDFRSDAFSDTRARTSAVSYDPGAQTLLCRLDLSLPQDWLTENAGSLFGYETGGVSVQVRVNSIRVRDEEAYFTLPLSQCPLTTDTLPIGSVQENIMSHDENGRYTFGPDEYISLDGYQWYFDFSFGGGLDPFAHFRDETGAPAILRPQPDMPWDWLYAVGFMEDALHVQTAPWLPYQSGGTHAGVGWVGVAETDREQELIDRYKSETAGSWRSTSLMLNPNAEKLLDVGLFRIEDGQAILCTSYNDTENLMESCFELSRSDAAGYSLVFRYLDTEDLYPGLITGPFQLGDQQLGEAKAFLDLDFDGISVDRMRVSPLSVIFVGSRGELAKINTLEIVSGGTSTTCTRISGLGWNGDPERIVSASWFVDGVPVNMEELTAVRVNGKEFPLEKE